MKAASGGLAVVLALGLVAASARADIVAASAQTDTVGPPTQADTIAVLEGLNKVTARVSRFDAPVGQAVRFGNLVITVRACDKRPPEEPPQTAAFLQIEKVQRGEGNDVSSKQIFSGWMFAASPAISALEDPVYDVSLLDCKTETSAAPSSGPAGK